MRAGLTLPSSPCSKPRLARGFVFLRRDPGLAGRGDVAGSGRPTRRAGAALLTTALLVGPGIAGAQVGQRPPPFREALESRDTAAATTPGSATVTRRTTLLVGAGIAGVAAYGLAKWWDDGFDARPDFQREGWFGRGTEFGGIDKLGHAYSNYVGVRLLTPLLQALGNDADSARNVAFWSTAATFVGIEVVDAFSRQYKASAEDLVANASGAVLALALLRNPGLDRLVDFRLGYRRSTGSGWDPAGDYEGQVYHLVFKAEGVPALRHHPVARYLEVSLGYAARGFDPAPGTFPERRRELHAGIGLNLSRLLADIVWKGASSPTRAQQAADLAFELIQFPVNATTRIGLD